MENFIFNIKKLIKNKKIKIAINVFLILISFGTLFYFCIQNNNLINLIYLLPHLNLMYLQIAFLCMILSWSFDSFIIKELTKEICKQSYRNILFLKITMVGQYFTTITPLGIAAQPMQISELCRYGINKNASVSLLLRKFYIYQLSLLIYSVTSALLYYWRIKNCHIDYLCPLILTGILFQGTIIFLVLLFSLNKNLTLHISKFSVNVLYKLKIVKNKEKTLNSLVYKLEYFITNNKNLSKNKKLNFKLFVFTFLELTFTFLITFFIFKTFNHNSFPIVSMTYTQNVTVTISSFTPLPGSAGTSENMFLVLFKPFFYENELVTAMIIYRFISFYFALIPGMIFYKVKIKNFQK